MRTTWPTSGASAHWQSNGGAYFPNRLTPLSPSIVRLISIFKQGTKVLSCSLPEVLGMDLQIGPVCLKFDVNFALVLRDTFDLRQFGERKVKLMGIGKPNLHGSHLQDLVKIAGLATLVACLPSMLQQLRKPSPKGLLYCMANTASAFYMFSYQVHHTLRNNFSSSSQHLVSLCQVLLARSRLLPYKERRGKFSACVPPFG